MWKPWKCIRNSHFHCALSNWSKWIHSTLKKYLNNVFSHFHFFFFFFKAFSTQPQWPSAARTEAGGTQSSSISPWRSNCVHAASPSAHLLRFPVAAAAVKTSGVHLRNWSSLWLNKSLHGAQRWPSVRRCIYGRLLPGASIWISGINLCRKPRNAPSQESFIPVSWLAYWNS